MPNIIECSQNTSDWLKIRKGGIGGSDAPAALGVSKWLTPYGLWLEKTNPNINEQSKWVFERGKAFEPIIRKFYADLTGDSVLVPNGILQHDKYGYMLSSLDGFVDCGNYRKGFEAKVSYSSEGWGQPGGDDIPTEYYIQCQHNMIVGGIDVFDLAVSIYGREPDIYTIEKDMELSELIIEAEAKFWEKVVKKIPPNDFSTEDISSKFPNAKNQAKEASQEILDACIKSNETKKKIADLYKTQDLLKAQIMEYMGESNQLVFSDTTLATWNNRAGSIRLDSKKLKQEMPDVFAKYARQGNSTRTLLIK